MTEKTSILARDLPLISGVELTPEERKEFDYLSPETLDESQFFRHENEVYGLHDFLRFSGPTVHWDGHMGLNYFCHLVVKCSPCGEAVTLGRVTT